MSDVLILAVYCGFSAIWGWLLRSAHHDWAWLAWLFGFIVMLPASLGLPVDGLARYVFWILGLIGVIIFFWQPVWLPSQLWRTQTTRVYFDIIMLLTVVWVFLEGKPILWLYLGLPALSAAILGWRRMLQGDDFSREAV